MPFILTFMCCRGLLDRGTGAAVGSEAGDKSGEGLPWETSGSVALLSLGSQLHLCKQQAFSPGTPGV